MNSDRNLLFGILALQMDFISRDQLVDAMSLWVTNKSKPLEDILEEQQALSGEARGALITLVRIHIKKHGDATQSLAVLSSVGSIKHALATISDCDVEASVGHLGDGSADQRETTFPSHVRSISDQRRIDGLCVEFEKAFQTSQQPGIEAFLQEARNDLHQHLFQALLSIELVYRNRNGEHPMGQEYRDRFPQYSDIIVRVFSAATSVDRSLDHSERESFTLPFDGPSNTNRFHILRPHAKGGLGQVSIALDVELNREVALKEIQDQYADHPQSRSRFVVEAEINGGLEHPGIVPVYGLGHYDNGRPYYAMRFIKGDSMKQAADEYHKNKSGDPSERSLQLRKLLGRFADVCNAIEYAHSRGVLHRDLKPGNIMLGKYGETLVVDWGLAKPVGRSDKDTYPDEQTLKPSSVSCSAPTQVGKAIGTPAFMSPEQADGRLDELDTTSDVYSLGATLYYVLTGKGPVGGNTNVEVLEKVRRGDLIPPREVHADIPKPLSAICMRAMAKDQKQRYASPQALADDVERFLADEPVASFVEPMSVRSRRWMRKHPKTVASMAATLLVGLTCTLIIATVVSGQNIELADKNEQLDGKNVELAVAIRLEVKSTTRAHARFSLALDSIQKYHQGIIHETLFERTEFRDLRRKLLNDATAFYGVLRTELESDSTPASTVALAKSLGALAEVEDAVGELSKAVMSLDQAIGLIHDVIDESPSSNDHSEFLADIHLQRASVLAQTTHLADAEKSCSRTIALRNDLYSNQPSTVHLLALAVAQRKMGDIQRMLGHSEKAFRFLDSAIRSANIGIAEGSTEESLKVEKAKSMATKATVHAQLAHNTEEAFNLYQQSAALLEDLGFQDELDHLHNLGAVYHNCGHVCGDKKQALEYYQKAVDLKEQLISKSPNISKYQATLSRSYTSLGKTHLSIDMQPSGIKFLSKAISIQRELVSHDDGVREYAMMLFNNLFVLGRLMEKENNLEHAVTLYTEAIQLIDGLKTRERLPIMFIAEYFDLAYRHSQTCAKLDRQNEALDSLNTGIGWSRGFIKAINSGLSDEPWSHDIVSVIQDISEILACQRLRLCVLFEDFEEAKGAALILVKILGIEPTELNRAFISLSARADKAKNDKDGTPREITDQFLRQVYSFVDMQPRSSDEIDQRMGELLDSLRKLSISRVFPAGLQKLSSTGHKSEV